MSKINDIVRKAPNFWQRNGLITQFLAPFSFIYKMATTWHLSVGYPWHTPSLVICVGNLITGGAGKTPVVLSVSRVLQKWNIQSIVLTRGYGGSIYGPLQVTEQHTANQVGDEAVLLKSELPTVVSRCRVEGAKLALSLGAHAIIMDDGYQNASVYKDIALVVIEGYYGFGNGYCLPRGPLRESIAQGLTRASAVVLIGHDCCTIRQNMVLPLIDTNLTYKLHVNSLLDKQVIAFTGIGHPEKFFTALKSVGAHLIACYHFADHKLYRHSEISSILDKATILQATIVTTAKDVTRLPINYRKSIDILKTVITLSNTDTLKACIFSPYRSNFLYHY